MASQHNAQKPETPFCSKFKEVVMELGYPLPMKPYNWLAEVKVYNQNYAVIPYSWFQENADIIVLYFSAKGVDRHGVIEKFYSIYESAKIVNIPLEVINVPTDENEEDMRDSFEKQANWFTLLHNDTYVRTLQYMYNITATPHLYVLKIDGTVISTHGILDIDTYGKNAIIAWISPSSAAKRHRRLSKEVNIYGDRWLYAGKGNRREYSGPNKIPSSRKESALDNYKRHDFKTKGYENTISEESRSATPVSANEKQKFKPAPDSVEPFVYAMSIASPKTDNCIRTDELYRRVYEAGNFNPSDSLSPTITQVNETFSPTIGTTESAEEDIPKPNDDRDSKTEESYGGEMSSKTSATNTKHLHEVRLLKRNESNETYLLKSRNESNVYIDDRTVTGTFTEVESSVTPIGSTTGETADETQTDVADDDTDTDTYSYNTF